MSLYLIIGASSDLAKATIELLLESGASCILVARNRSMCDDFALNHPLSSQIVDIIEHDICHQSVETLLETLTNELTGVICFVGSLTPQSIVESNTDALSREIFVNYTGIVTIFNALSTRFIAQGHGIMACIGSVAGDRGRPGNYVYGSAKAGLAVYLEGLQARLFKHNVHVCIIKPGFIQTKMLPDTAGPSFLIATPERIATDIITAIKKKKRCVYTPWFWRGIMMVIKAIPSRLFVRLSL